MGHMKKAFFGFVSKYFRRKEQGNRTMKPAREEMGHGGREGGNGCFYDVFGFDSEWAPGACIVSAALALFHF